MTQETARGATRRCPAPKITTGAPCGRWLLPGAALCQAHADTDRRRRCEGQARKGRETIRCHAWPLEGLPFCDAHEPARCETRRLERQAFTARLVRLRQAWAAAHPRTQAAALERLMQAGKLAPEDLEAALREYGIVTGRP